MGELREVEAKNGSCRDESSNHRGAGSDDGNHRGEGCSHGVEVDHGRSSRQMVDNHRRRRLDEMVEESESGSGRYGESRLESVDGFNYGANWEYEWETYISQAANAGSFEILTIQFVDCDFKV